jgi:hypothetical protein
MEQLFLFFYLTIGLGVSFLVTLIWFLVYYFWIRPTNYMPRNTDIQVFLTKENRFELNFQDTKNLPKIKYDGDSYNIIEHASLLNKKGKSLGIWSKGKPLQLDLKYDESKWLDNKSLSNIINNELIEKVLRPKDLLGEILLILCTITSVISCIVIIIVALKIFGVIKSKQVVETSVNQVQVIR